MTILHDQLANGRVFAMFWGLCLIPQGFLMDHVNTKLYKQSPTPILYVGPCDLMLGMVPLFPLFLKGRATPPIPHKLQYLKGSAFSFGTADAAAANGSREAKSV